MSTFYFCTFVLKYRRSRTPISHYNTGTPWPRPHCEPHKFTLRLATTLALWPWLPSEFDWFLWGTPGYHPNGYHQGILRLQPPRHLSINRLFRPRHYQSPLQSWKAL